MHPNSNARPNRWIIVWLVVLTVALFISIAGNAALVQAANDPPVKVFQANLDDVGAMTGANAGTIISSTSFTPVVQVISSQLSNNHPHACVAVASVGADFAAGGGQYSIGLGLDSIDTISTNSKREFELPNTADNDPNFIEATTTHTFLNISGVHSFSLLAKRNTNDSGNFVVDEATLVVMCFKKVIGAQ